jgi:PAS domain-containing protein
MEYKAFLDACPLGIFIVNAQGQPYYANLKAIEVLGKGVLPSANIEQLNAIYQAYQVGTNQLYPLTDQPLLRALQGEVTCITDLEVHRGGEIIPLQVTAAPVQDEAGRIRFAMAIFEDIQYRQDQVSAQNQLHQELIRRNQGLQQENDSLKRKLQMLEAQLKQLQAFLQKH